MRRIGNIHLGTNPVAYNLRHGLPSVGTWLNLCSPAAAESLANLGWDWLTVDVEHSPVGIADIANMFRAIQLGGAVPLARIAWNDPVSIQRVLDAGALGLVVPMVNTAEQARQVVANMRYGPHGQRSLGGNRTRQYVEGDYASWALENIAIIVMIEHIEAVENAEEILSVEGVDAGFIGPTDLAMSMGETKTGPGTEHEQAIMRVLEAGKKVGTAVGKHCQSAEEVNMRIEQGFQFLALSSDAGFMMKEARAQLAAIKPYA